MKPFDKAGYPCVKLFKNGKFKHRLVHWLILETFVGPRPEGMLGLHKNDIQSDCRVENLEWGPPKKNRDDHWGNFRDYKSLFKFVLENYPEILKEYKEKRPGV